MSTRPRTAAVLISLLLTGPVLLAGCGDDGTSEAGATSSASTQPPSKDGSEESTAEAAPAETDTADAADAPDAADFVADTEADIQAASADAAVTVSAVRIGAHDGFDRVVFEVGGTGTPGWDVRYVDTASSQGTGDPVDVAGNAVLQVTVTGAGYPYDTGVEEYAGGPLTGSGTSAVTEVVWDATFEGTSVAFIGTTAENPFRVYALSDPARVVVEVAQAG